MKQDESMKYSVEKEDAGIRLDLFLAQRNNSLSRTSIKKAIVESGVTVNGDVEYRANYKVSEGDYIVLDSNKVSKDLAETEIRPERMDLDIIYEDNDLLVVNKPAGGCYSSCNR